MAWNFNNETAAVDPQLTVGVLSKVDFLNTDEEGNTTAGTRYYRSGGYRKVRSADFDRVRDPYAGRPSPVARKTRKKIDVPLNRFGL